MLYDRHLFLFFCLLHSISIITLKKSYEPSVFVHLFSLPLSESPWKTNDVLSCASSLFTDWQSGKVEAFKCRKADEYANDWRQRRAEPPEEKWKQRGSSGEWYVSFGDVMHPSVQGNSGGGNSLSQRMTSTPQAVRQVVKGLSPTLPLFSG